jgi:hypothetical protein
MTSVRAVVTVDARDTVICDGAVAVDADRIVAVGPTRDVLARYPRAERVDAAGKAGDAGLLDDGRTILQRLSTFDLVSFRGSRWNVVDVNRRPVSPANFRSRPAIAARAPYEPPTVGGDGQLAHIGMALQPHPLPARPI